MAPEDAPVTLDELADLQAGLLEPDDEERLRRRVARDPEAARLLGALEVVADELDAVPDEPVPDDVVARLDAAIAAEQQGGAVADGSVGSDGADGPTRPAPVTDLDAARRRRRRVVQGLGVAAAAAALLGAVVVLRPSSPGPTPASVPAYGAADLASAWPEVGGLRDLGALGDPQQLRLCSTVADAPSGEVLGARPVTLDGRPGVLVAYPAPPGAGGPQVTLVVYDPACGTDAVLARTTVAR